MTTLRPIIAELSAHTSDQGLDVNALAAALGVAPNTLTRWRHGHRSPYFSSAVAWADLLGYRITAANRSGRVFAVGLSIPVNLRGFRLASRLTQGALARRLCVSQETVSHRESNVFPPFLATVDDHLVGLGLRLELRPAALMREVA
jgi:transcriptional regulator with XRE-family HTH domain